MPEIRPTLPSDKTMYYRNKLEFTYSSKRWFEWGVDPDSVPAEERVGLGFHVGKLFDKVLDIKRCYLQKDPSNDIRIFCKEYAFAHGLEFLTSVRTTGSSGTCSSVRLTRVISW